MKFSRIYAIAASFAFGAAFAANIPKHCTEEITALSKGSSFDMKKFAGELPPAVAKAKVQAKAPFGKPKDGEKTSIGITFGCLKDFPESPSEIQSLLKDLGTEMAKGIAGDYANSASNNFQDSPKKESVEGRDVIYLQNGQKVTNATVTEVGIDEVKYRVGARVAVYVAKKSDISAISYSDGAKDFFCGGVPYSSATHFCSAGQAYSCGSKPYNPETQFCHNGKQVLKKCGKEKYDPSTHLCRESQIVSKFGKCGDKSYDLTTHFCYAGQAYSCGNKPYNPETQFCHNGNQILKKCGKEKYDPATHLCRDSSQIVSRFSKCGDKSYDSDTHFCHRNQVFAKCGKEQYNPETHYCNERVAEVYRR
jgi:hypothetical protein